MNKVVTSEKVFVVGDVIGYVGFDGCGFGKVHGDFE